MNRADRVRPGKRCQGARRGFQLCAKLEESFRHGDVHASMVCDPCVARECRKTPPSIVNLSGRGGGDKDVQLVADWPKRNESDTRQVCWLKHRSGDSSRLSRRRSRSGNHRTLLVEWQRMETDTLRSECRQRSVAVAPDSTRIEASYEKGATISGHRMRFQAKEHIDVPIVLFSISIRS